MAPLLAVPLALLAAACGGGGGGAAAPRGAPRIRSFTPDAGHAGSTLVTLQPIPALGVDEILIRGDLFMDDPEDPAPLIVRVTGPDGPEQLEPGQVTVLGATLVRLLVPTGTALGPAFVATRLGVSDVFLIP